MIAKIFQLAQRKMNARQWGLNFTRVRDFRIPTQLRLGEREIEIELPVEESGMMAEFIEIILDDCYHLKSWRKSLDPQAKILDIGGNVGLFSLAARQFFPQATIHAYEPNPALKGFLEHQAQLANFAYYLKAVGETDGNISLQFSEKGSANTASIFDRGGYIPMVAFDKAIKELGGSVDLAKIDCEGAEWELFKAKEVWSNIKNVTMEYHLYKKQHTLNELRKTITNLGFKIQFLKPTNQYYGNLIATKA